MTADKQQASPAREFSWARALGFLLLTVALTTAATVWIIKAYVFPPEFKPVELSAKEERVLDEKIERLEGFASSSAALEPEAYSEKDADREILLSERELNALVAKNTDLARRVAIDFSEDLVSAKVLMPMDEDFPILGGQIIRLRAGLELGYMDERPVVILKGVSVMGVPLPSAWLGGLKNIDLVKEFGGDEGIWKAFAAGVEELDVSDGQLRVRLRE
jgi:hypothetical protein